MTQDRGTLTIAWALWRARFRYAAECDYTLVGHGPEAKFVFFAQELPEGDAIELEVANNLLDLDREVALNVFRDAIQHIRDAQPSRWALRAPGDLRLVESLVSGVGKGD